MRAHARMHAEVLPHLLGAASRQPRPVGLLLFAESQKLFDWGPGPEESSYEKTVLVAVLVSAFSFPALAQFAKPKREPGDQVAVDRRG